MSCANNAIQRDGGQVIVIGETWVRNISIVDREIAENETVRVIIMTQQGTTIYSEDFDDLQIDGSVNVTIPAATTSTFVAGRYIIRFFLIIDDTPYLINLNSNLYVTR